MSNATDLAKFTDRSRNLVTVSLPEFTVDHMTIAALREKLDEMELAAIEQGLVNFQINACATLDGDVTYMDFYGTRTETDKEFLRRCRAEDKVLRQKRALMPTLTPREERVEYERLKAKFEAEL